MSAYQNMKIVLLRHGQRSAGYGDVPLSQDGLDQANKLALIPLLQTANHLISSPKIRTQQTIEPLSQQIHKPIVIAPELDQRKSIETENEFIQRVMTFMHECSLSYTEQTVVLCSHSDWLQMAIMNLPLPMEKAVQNSFFACAQYHTLTYQNRTWDFL